MNKPKGLTLTILFEGQSLNYDEGYGNLSILKKIHRGDGKTYTYSSRQSIRYSIFTQGKTEFGWTPSDVINSGKGDSTVVQLTSAVSDSEESDLFGFMRTDVELPNTKLLCTRTRVAPVKITPAISLEPYDSDIEFLTNKYQADKKQLQPNIANIETHKSLYRYTICVDLHRIGSEYDDISNKIMPQKNYEKNKEKFDAYIGKIRENDIGNNAKSDRVCQLLDVISTLYRDIRGRREDLKPLFVIGGVYDTLNPFFVNTVFVKWQSDKPIINVDSLKQQITANNSKIAKDTFVGIRNGMFANDNADLVDMFGESLADNVGSPESVFAHLKDKVLQYYS